MGLFRKNKSLSEHLKETKKVTISGVIFEIQKIDTSHYLSGLDVLQNIHALYKLKKSGQDVKTDPKNEIKKIKNYCRDILLAGVVKPKLSAKEGGENIHVDEIFADFYMAQKLTEAIVQFTYKKK
jgi:hypothetical protein